MTKVECGSWQLELDVEATRRAYRSIQVGGPETCGCAFCRNFAAARELAYPAAVLAFYEPIGRQRPTKLARPNEMVSSVMAAGTTVSGGCW